MLYTQKPQYNNCESAHSCPKAFWETMIIYLTLNGNYANLATFQWS